MLTQILLTQNNCCNLTAAVLSGNSFSPLSGYLCIYFSTLISNKYIQMVQNLKSIQVYLWRVLSYLPSTRVTLCSSPASFRNIVGLLADINTSMHTDILVAVKDLIIRFYHDFLILTNEKLGCPNFYL